MTSFQTIPRRSDSTEVSFRVYAEDLGSAWTCSTDWRGFSGIVVYNCAALSGTDD
jgi:hypothetical protein